ncbi:SET domain-containing protein [Sanghuangporus baumii]|uniref:SET domain-containing protein n=1 Tax=Sanghuangporus baumii TaxID=108892 RepID=A0A9Q5HZ09_SANBA|nr:SET domain-containing protein [Sanghuangporus baumii]
MSESSSEDTSSEYSSSECSDSSDEYADRPLRPPLVYRYCRTPDCKRVIGVWLLYEEVNDRYSCDNGWAIPETPLPAPYEIREIEGKGRGMIATRDIKVKELIIRERPVLMTPAKTYYTRSSLKSRWLEIDKKLLQFLYWLEQEDREKVVQLHNCKPPEECGPLAGIVRTNALAASFSGSEVCEYYSSICLNMCLINHSCAPNAYYSFEEKDVTFSVMAQKDIAAGEEITISYIDGFMPRAARQAELKLKYCFTCACSLCSKPDAESAASDERRKFISKTTDSLYSGEMWKSWVACPRNRKNAQTKRDVETVEALLHALEIENEVKGRTMALRHCIAIYGATAHMKNFKKWARRLLKYETDDKSQVEGWIKNPRSFPKWNMLYSNVTEEVPITVVSPEAFLRMMACM